MRVIKLDLLYGKPVEVCVKNHMDAKRLMDYIKNANKFVQAEDHDDCRVRQWVGQEMVYRDEI